MKKYLNADELTILIKEKEQLENKNNLSQLEEKILENLLFTLFSGCKHNPIFDEIDIDIEKTMNICYCEKCYLTFNTPFIVSYLTKNLDFSKYVALQIGKKKYKLNEITTKNQEIILHLFIQEELKTHKFNFSFDEFIHCTIFDNTIILNN